MDYSQDEILARKLEISHPILSHICHLAFSCHLESFVPSSDRVNMKLKVLSERAENQAAHIVQLQENVLRQALAEVNAERVMAEHPRELPNNVSNLLKIHADSVSHAWLQSISELHQQIDILKEKNFKLKFERDIIKRKCVFKIKIIQQQARKITALKKLRRQCLIQLKKFEEKSVKLNLRNHQLEPVEVLPAVVLPAKTKKRRQYTKEQLNSAENEVMNGSTLGDASKKFGVPKETIRLKSRHNKK